MIGIQVVSLAGQPAPSPAAAWFGAEGGDIGRGADCALALPDPERRISRKHASILCRAGRYYIRVVSTSVPMELDGSALLAGQEALLNTGGTIRIGGYLLRVIDEPESMGLGRAAAQSGEPRGAFADLLLDLPSSGAAAQAKPSSAAAAMQVDLLVGEPSGRHAARRKAVPPAGPARAAPAPAALASAPMVGANAAAAALLAGLGLSRPNAAQLTPEHFERVGALLRAMTGGTVELLTARMLAKRELGADATQLRSRENNPLKFAPDVDAALAHLLGPAERGFLPPLLAAKEAFDDLQAHQVALLAGMRAALDSVMSRFDPAALEQRLAPVGAWENLIPANRKARLWTEYSEQFERIVNEVEGEFDALLGRAFLKAYQAQLAEFARAGADRSAAL